ncbi:MAG TPA: hypothetical protein VF485_16030 [Sphingomonas sp.]
MSDDDWFAPKKFGYGTGLPIAWQGWALISGYIVILVASGLFLAQHHNKLFILIAVIGALAVKVIAARHTRGGWKWRWRGEA